MNKTKLTPTVIFIITFILGMLISWLNPWNMTDYLSKELIRIIGVIILLISLLLNAIAYRGFKKYLTPHAPFLTPTVLLQSGVFALSRNPVYLALVLSELGLAFVFDAFWLVISSGLLLLILDRKIISEEERILQATFKTDYTAYKNKTRRWI